MIRDGDVLDFGGGARIIASPGHTDGSIAVYLPVHGILFTGDTVAEHLGRVMLGLFNRDTEQTLRPMRHLAELAVEFAAFGHGEPVRHHAADRLREAVEALEV
jgi:glyoxylase-like metal-dependent hydrolase (beta-lactamase superfamily II)